MCVKRVKQHAYYLSEAPESGLSMAVRRLPAPGRIAILHNKLIHKGKTVQMKYGCALSVGDPRERPEHGSRAPAGPRAIGKGGVPTILSRVVHLHKIIHDVGIEAASLLSALVPEACTAEQAAWAHVTLLIFSDLHY